MAQGHVASVAATTRRGSRGFHVVGLSPAHAAFFTKNTNEKRHTDQKVFSRERPAPVSYTSDGRPQRWRPFRKLIQRSPHTINQMALMSCDGRRDRLY